ncbi:MAG TPA: citramalate synthase, partial [Candidatus Melainabacteria bacterium]|nr:citramalate synthase [Candidatus Melainabacteria bacterium]
MYRRNREDEDKSVHLYDTTLRDGSQKKGISFSLDDKVKIASLLDRLGVSYIEAGWPGSNPKDMAFFERIKKAPLKHSKVVAFGSTRKAGVTCEEDANLKALLDAETPAVTLVGKSSVMHVEKVLRVSKEENLSMISESIAFLKARGKEVAFDAEHFFDGYALDKEYSLSCLVAAADSGCDFLVLCDTNGGSMPDTIASVVAEVNSMFPGKVGIHAHNDAELAVANSLAAVQAGARQIQGTINGYGERCGNANLISLAPSLYFKLGYKCLPEESFKELTKISRSISEIANLSPDPY